MTLAVKKRIGRAKQAAFKALRDVQYDVIPSDNRIFCLVASRDKEIRLIRVVIDECSPRDIESIREFRAPSAACTKEVWIRRPDNSGFDTVIVQ